MLLAIGGFMLMPFGSAFCVHNLGIPLEKLPVLYMCTGLASIAAGPTLGKVSDALGKYPTFVAGSVVGMVLVLYYTHLGVTPLFIAITARMVSAQALTSAVPEPQDRGAYMSIASSLQQLAGGVASSVAGLLVTQTGDGPIEHYDRLGFVVCGAMAATVGLMFQINRMVTGAPAGGPNAGPSPVATAGTPPAS
jgi:predicted MFS family arabinose efflux permease